jgi:pimeloyl-ACP methyl ester carboxylesterase
MTDFFLKASSGNVKLLSGSRPVLLVHEIGASSLERSSVMRHARSEWQAWTYVQRGHSPSPWLRGGYYSLSMFSIDLIRILECSAEPPKVLAAQGASALVAAFVAVARPELVAGIEVLESGSGWMQRPDLLVNAEVLPNRDWMNAIYPRKENQSGGVQEGEDDPLLFHGPPQSLLDHNVHEILSVMDRPWHSRTRCWVQDWLPPKMFSDVSLV